MDQVMRTLARYTWPYSDQDPEALTEIARRVADVGRRRAPPLTYSQLVSGITFRIASVNHGRPLSLGVPEWIDLHRAILGDFLGRLCLATYERGRFLGSALVVSGDPQRPYPSEGFRELARDLGLFAGRDEDACVIFWAAEVAKAHDWYATHAW